MQTDLDKIKEWIAKYPGHNILNQFLIDFTDKIPNTGGIFPNGLVEVSRSADIMGNVSVVNQYNFGLYYNLLKSPGQEAEAEANAEWVGEFQKWVQEQSCRGLAPVFGDEPQSEKITAQNGTLIEASDEGSAIYTIQLTVQFTKNFKEV